MYQTYQFITIFKNHPNDKKHQQNLTVIPIIFLLGFHIPNTFINNIGITTKKTNTIFNTLFLLNTIFKIDNPTIGAY